MRLAQKGDVIFTRTGTHALKALAFLASLPPAVFADARVIAERVGAPPNYLAKLLGQLARAGTVTARKGAGGGFRLARAASSLSLYEALEPVEQLVTDKDCIFGGGTCGGRTPCALHGRWEGIRADMIDFLRNTHLDQLGSDRLASEAVEGVNARRSKEAS